MELKCRGQSLGLFRETIEMSLNGSLEIRPVDAEKAKETDHSWVIRNLCEAGACVPQAFGRIASERFESLDEELQSLFECNRIYIRDAISNSLFERNIISKINEGALAKLFLCVGDNVDPIVPKLRRTLQDQKAKEAKQFSSLITSKNISANVRNAVLSWGFEKHKHVKNSYIKHLGRTLVCRNEFECNIIFEASTIKNSNDYGSYLFVELLLVSDVEIRGEANHIWWVHSDILMPSVFFYRYPFNPLVQKKNSSDAPMALVLNCIYRQMQMLELVPEILSDSA